MSDTIRHDDTRALGAHALDPSTTGAFAPVTPAPASDHGDARTRRGGTRTSRTRRSLIAAAALSLGLLAGATAFAAPAQAGMIGGLGMSELAVLSAAGALPSASVSVTGTGTVSVEPDVAKLSFATEADGDDATSAAESANALAETINAALEEYGVPAEDIQTGGVSVSPRYTYDDAGNGTIAGYTASVQYDLSGVAVAEVSQVISRVLDAGAMQVYTVAYYSSTYDEQYQKALAMAFEQAEAKADALLPTLADSPDAALTLKDVTESPSSMQYRYADAGAFAAMDQASGASGAEAAKANATVVPGTIDIEANVTVEYGLFDPAAYEPLINGIVTGADGSDASDGGAERVASDSRKADAK